MVVFITFYISRYILSNAFIVVHTYRETKEKKQMHDKSKYEC